jgi:two-component system, NtrC family, sensor histidine kinase HydH
LGRMMASVSHEIKTPLGIIRSTGELLGSQMEEDDPSQRLTQVIVEECTRLNRIVTEFLDFARPQQPNLRPCRADEIIQRNLDAIAPELDKQGITLKSDLTEGKETLLDPDLLYRAFLNILVNAIQAMPEGGSLGVTAGPTKNGGWRIQVSDTGQGISEEHRERVFEPFYTQKEKGSGLGLSIVKSIIEAHDGRIEIRSPDEGGTLIEIVI